MRTKKSLSFVMIASTLFVLALLICLFTITSVFIIRRSLNYLEINTARANIQKAQNLYKYILSAYERKIVDWGQWDDTYEFINDLNIEYITSNLGENTLTNLAINKMIFFDSAGVFRYATISNESDVTYKDDNSKLERFIVDNQIIKNIVDQKGITSGLYEAPDGTYMYAVQKITHSDGSGTPRGYILFATHIGTWFANDLSTVAQLPVYTSKELTQDTTKLAEDIYVSQNKIYSLVHIQTDNSRETMTLAIEDERSVWQMVNRNFWIILALITSYGILSALMNNFVVRKFILEDILNLRKEVASIESREGVGRVVDIGKSSEIEGLRKDINSLLGMIEESKKIAEEKIVELNRLNSLMVGRENKMAQLKRVISEVKKRII